LQHIHVMAGALIRGDGKVLLGLRPAGRHQGGLWEFPGGKRAPGESRESALKRELDEELGIRVLKARPLISVDHDYPERKITLDVWRVDQWRGKVFGREGQTVDWVAPGDFGQRHFPPADVPVLRALSLPARYLITGDWLAGDSVAGFSDHLARCLDRTGIGLMQLRVKSCPPDNLARLLAAALTVCQAHDCQLLLNCAGLQGAMTAASAGAGVHLSGTALTNEVAQRLRGAQGAGVLIGASCHNAEQLTQAQNGGADFVVLSPVHPTTSHPGADTLGWSGFGRLAGRAQVPVFALGGMGSEDLSQAWAAGGQGVAAISAFWQR
jgi:8-oxo-dGTP diphosphatase